MDYGDGLENRCGGNVTGGSNPSPSATKGFDAIREGAGVAERGGLLSRCTRKRTVGSNPTPPALNVALLSSEVEGRAVILRIRRLVV